MEGFYTSLAMLTAGIMLGLSIISFLVVLKKTNYQLYAVWQSEAALTEFKISPEYQMLKGSFLTLGEHHHTTSGRTADSICLRSPKTTYRNNP